MPPRRPVARRCEPEEQAQLTRFSAALVKGAGRRSTAPDSAVSRSSRPSRAAAREGGRPHLSLNSLENQRSSCGKILQTGMDTRNDEQDEEYEEDEEGTRLLPFDLLNLKINEKDKLVSCDLKMPSKLPTRYDSKEQGKNAKVVLDLKSDNSDGLHCSKMMIEIIHPNILNAKVIVKGKSYLLLWVEPYNGNLLDYLGKLLGGLLTPHPQAPWTFLQNIVRQVVYGLEHLMVKGYYHGNFMLKNTYYELRGYEIIVKLTNFKRKGGRTPLCQWEDLVDLGAELTTLSGIADKLSKEFKRQVYDCTLLNDLALKLKKVTRENLGRNYMKIKRHVFFWEEFHRKKFFVYYVPMKMKMKGFISKINECEALRRLLPWNHNDYDGFLQLMNHYRGKQNRRAYKGSASHLVSFICGLYTHEHEPELQNYGKKVDDVIMRVHPYICLILGDLLGSSEEDWL